jgi:hypothetical protein
MNRAIGNAILAPDERTICSMAFSQLSARRDGGHIFGGLRRMIFLL